MDKMPPTWWRRRPGLRGITRHFTIDSVAWRVFEYLCAFDPPSDLSLIFVCDATYRRIRVFPADWATRDDSTLFALSGAH
jgi:hypothetical protein